MTRISLHSMGCITAGLLSLAAGAAWAQNTEQTTPDSLANQPGYVAPATPENHAESDEAKNPKPASQGKLSSELNSGSSGSDGSVGTQGSDSGLGARPSDGGIGARTSDGGIGVRGGSGSN